MVLKIISSNSSGNCYVMKGQNSSLVIECGVSLAKLKQSLDFDLSDVHSALVTHEHGDHFAHARKYAEAGINVYGSAGTLSGDNGRRPDRFKVVEADREFSLGEFRVYPFHVKHDAREPFGYYINHPECGNTLFLTDSFYTDKKFAGLNNIIVEANFCQVLLDRKLEADKIDPFLYNRIVKSHMSIQTCQRLLAANDLRAVNNIILIHLSDSNSDEAGFKLRIETYTGKTVHVARENTEIQLNKTPF